MSEQSDDAPGSLFDFAMIQTLESRAIELSNNFNTAVEHLQHQAQQMSVATLEAGGVYSASVRQLSNELQASTTQTVELISQCDELDKDLVQLGELAKQM
ncbi:hypothetical protein DFQ28_011096 [Apophysomyces sp. BC1034]|nr:hypothetical protein DFQ29_009154 [Apophysomyces sp. BC1021]KAG0184460.1 hypothetical protein DFQ28_011096 [Apophysomyces sp. BC1034]